MAHSLRHGCLVAVILLVLNGVTIVGSAPVLAQSGSATSSAILSDDTPHIAEQIEVTISIDVSGVDPPDNALGSFTSSLDWDPAVLAYNSTSGVLAGFTGVVNTGPVLSGHIIFNGANTSGATGNVTVLRITFDVVGSGSSDLDLEYTAMAAAGTFRDLLPLLTVYDGYVEVSPAQCTLTLAVDPVGGGVTDPAAGVHTYAGETVVDVTATPNSGYEFDHWSGACTGAGTCQVTMDADKSVTAHFADRTLPDTGITARPDDPSHSTDASFSFTSTKPGSTFECQLDGGGFSACTNPKTYSDLMYGDHTFEVYAIDGAGKHDPTPASYSWRITSVVFLPTITNGELHTLRSGANWTDRPQLQTNHSVASVRKPCHPTVEHGPRIGRRRGHGVNLPLRP